MRKLQALLRAALLACLTLPASCATSLESLSEGDEHELQPKPVQVTQLSDDRLALFFEPASQSLDWETLRVEEAHALLVTFLQSCPDIPEHQVIPVRASPIGAPAPWERRLRAEFLARYGPGQLPMPDSLQRSPLFMALKLSPRYMGRGFRDAARELFRSPAFLASVTLSILVYFSAWLLPEPLFSKAFAATLTARLALAVGLLELRNIARVFLQLYREAEAARTMKELEAIAERFGRALGGTALRVLVMVASFGVARAFPNVPPGGLGPLLSPPRFAMAGGLSFQSASTAHVVADGTLVIAGAALGTAASAVASACTDGAQKKDGYQWHHLATDKNGSSPVQGGPWTPRFKRLFATAGMDLEDPANLVYLQGHKGPHPEEYHAEVYRRLVAALGKCRSQLQCRSNLEAELRKIAGEVCTPGSWLHRLATKA